MLAARHLHHIDALQARDRPRHCLPLHVAEPELAVGALAATPHLAFESDEHRVAPAARHLHHLHAVQRHHQVRIACLAQRRPRAQCAVLI
eukprot:6041950-Prymnesium_polylepis.1